MGRIDIEELTDVAEIIISSHLSLLREGLAMIPSNLHSSVVLSLIASLARFVSDHGELTQPEVLDLCKVESKPVPKSELN